MCVCVCVCVGGGGGVNYECVVNLVKVDERNTFYEL